LGSHLSGHDLGKGSGERQVIRVCHAMSSSRLNMYRFAFWFERLSVAFLVCFISAAHGGPPLQQHFKDQPADALIHRLHLEGDNSPSPIGLAVSKTSRWLPVSRILLIDSTVTNKRKEPATLEEVSLLEWVFRLPEVKDKSNFQRLTWRNDTWYGSTYWTGPNWTRVGKDWHHPGINTPSVRCFTAPRDGRVTITGRVYKAHLSGDGVRASIRQVGRTVWKADLKGKDDKGIDPNLTMDLRKGDRIRFVVHKLGRIFCDTTRWDPVVTYADGTRYRASEGFAEKKQGSGGWSYEMELDQQAERGLPRLLSFSSDFLPSNVALGEGSQVVLRDGKALPLWVIADADDRSGIALALDATGKWRLQAGMDGNGGMHLRLAVVKKDAPLSLKPGGSARLPRIALGVYQGSSHAGVSTLQRMLNCDPESLGMDNLLRCFEKAKHPELLLMSMVHADWDQQDKLTETAKSYAAATASHLDKTRELLTDIRSQQPAGFLAAEATQHDQFSRMAKLPAGDLAAQRSLYLKVRWLKREIALANPLMQFGKMLFCKRVPTSYSHLVMQYYGWRARAGGGIFTLDRPGRSFRTREITGDKLDDGSVLEPRLSYDARRIVFSYVKCRGKSYQPGNVANNGTEGYYHIWEINTDGSELRQLTDGPYDDLMPAYLPDGGIVFSSTRRRGYSRCFGGQFSSRWHIYTIHRMDGDGRNVRILSCHDTNEWFPTVTSDGRILYARWDYIDRDAVTHQNLWSMRPDGTNPIAVWGNATRSPHCSFQAKPIPGSTKFVFTASAHHSVTAGSLAIVDPTVSNDGQKAITRITPEIPFPESEGRNIREYYGSPWPLSEKYFLVAYSSKPLVWEPGANAPDALGIYLLDRFGNRELIYRDPKIGSTNPVPLVARQKPPVLATNLPPDAPATGEMLLTDIYQGLGDIPRDTIKELRIIQLFPKTTPYANNPRMGIAGEENGRAILGTVPVEPDGSARFTVPALKPLLFQALDKDGFAYQTMRTVTYVQPGESVSCVGCHENRMTATPHANPMAMRRESSTITPRPFEGRPFSFVESVQPVLDRLCVQCHGKEKTEGKMDLTGGRAGAWTRSYVSLTRNPKLVPRYPARNQIQTTPVGGVYGALGSGLMKMLRQGHEKVKLSGEELRLLAAWIDCNAIFYGTPNPADQARQIKGEPAPMPEIQ